MIARRFAAAQRRPIWTVPAASAVLVATLVAHGTALGLSLLASPDSYSVRHDRTLSVAAPGVLGNDVILLGSSTAVLNSGPAHGALTLQSNGAFTYTPTSGYVGTDTFRYHVHDGLLNTLPATVTVNVTNAVPVAKDDAYTATTGVAKTVAAPGVLSNDTDGDGDPLTAQLVDGGGNGSLDFNADGSFTFTSGGSFSGDRTFTYRVSDGFTWSPAATVTIAVSPKATPAPTPAPTPTPTPTRTPTPTPTPTSTPTSTPTPRPSPTPTATPTVLPLPSSIVTPSLLPLPSLPPVPTAVPTIGPLPTATASPAPSPEATSTDRGTVQPPGSGGSGGGAGGAGGPGAGTGDQLEVDEGPPLGTFDGLGTIVFTGFDWAVPGLALSVPGLLLILALAAQAGVGAFSLPVVRRRLGHFELRGRRAAEARSD